MDVKFFMGDGDNKSNKNGGGWNVVVIFIVIAALATWNRKKELRIQK